MENQNQKQNELTKLTNQLNEMIEKSKVLQIPIIISMEVGKQIQVLSSDQTAHSNAFGHIKALHESKGDVADFILSLCKIENDDTPRKEKLNNVKFENLSTEFTLTNPQTLDTKH
ncbi:hypothetical protein CAG54_00520 [Vibrio sp. V27_P1S3P104]|uniref:hypothetical protein n=1 Tax=unclassified Vibrio TaxID=2614977 RepID=UPI001373241A|nr:MULTISPECIES: hypothetical protein [unclassified Vibrio]NAX34092.1 hypothetical protein [Vibrio sp. V29_P1S30P107]NAX36009.1 hypothetical protein [Vibrio sp. V27_P1S3P104]